MDSDRVPEDVAYEDHVCLLHATSKRGLNREVRVALLRVGTEPECPEDNQRELTGSDGKESSFSADLGSIPGLGRSPGGGHSQLHSSHTLVK